MADHGLDDRGQIGARQRVTAFAGNGFVVDRDDGDEIGCRPLAARQQAQVRKRAFRAVKKGEAAVPVADAERRRPEHREREREREQCLEGPGGH